MRISVRQWKLSAIRSFPVSKSVSPKLIFSLALMLLVLPIQWVVSALVAAAFHEFCHYSAVRLCAGRIYSIRAATSGARMYTGELSTLQSIFCLIAGPAGSMSLLFLSRWFPRVAICGVCQGLYNLLPVFPLDGGRAVRCALEGVMSVSTADRIASVMEYLCLAAVFLLGLYGSCVLRLGLIPASAAIFMAYRVFREKHLENCCQIRYNKSSI